MRTTKLAYCKRCPYTYKETTGLQFLNKVNLLVSTLGKHYGGHLRIKRTNREKNELKKYQKEWDDPLVFEEFVKD